MIGLHVIFDFYECPLDILSDRERIEEALRQAALDGGLSLLGSVFHEFEPNGVSGALLLAESHLCIHTWPECGYAAADLFTCKKDTDVAAVEKRLRDCLKAGMCRRYEMQRGTEVKKSGLGA